jgi:ATP-binding cassette subfamily B protein
LAEPGPARRPLRALLDALDPRRRRQLKWLTVLTLANAAADLLFVASAMLFLAALASGGGPALPASLRDWLGPAAGDVSFAALAFGAGAVAANSVRLLYLWLSERTIAGITHELTVEVQRRVFAQPYAYHVRHHGSAMVAALEKVETVAFNLLHQWIEGVAALATGVAILGLLVSVDPAPALIAFAALAVLYLGIARLSGRRLAANSARLGPAYDERVRIVQESLGAIRDLIIDHSEHALLAEFRRADQRLTSAQASTRIIAAAPRFIVEAGAILLLAALAASLASRGGALVLIGGIALGGLRVLPLLQTAYRSWANLKANRSITGDVMELLSLPVPAAEPAVAPLPLQRSIRLDGVSFSYAGRGRPALADVTLDIACGQRVALVGETGSGKSTLADLVMGLLTPDAGRILVDGTPLDAANIRAWQRNLAHVSQSLFLADASIARNIAFSLPDQPPDLARVRRAAEQAAIADFVDALPEGYETHVGERGARLSGGQRQRIAIARALYKDAPVLILDEATNALDEATEAKVLANLFADQKRTILIIAHRASALGRCDQTIRLRDGRIVDGN